MPTRVTYSKIALTFDLFTKYPKKILPIIYALIHPISQGDAISSIYNERLLEIGVRVQGNSSNTTFFKRNTTATSQLRCTGSAQVVR